MDGNFLMLMLNVQERALWH